MAVSVVGGTADELRRGLGASAGPSAATRRRRDPPSWGGEVDEELEVPPFVGAA